MDVNSPDGYAADFANPRFSINKARNLFDARFVAKFSVE
jgi:hypothetical protein